MADQAPSDQGTQAPAIDWRRLHLWQVQPVRDVLVFLGVFGLLWLGYKLSLVTVPILLALALAYLFEPIVQGAVRRFGWMTRRTAAASIIVLALLIVLIPLTFGGIFGIAGVVSFVSDQATNVRNFAVYVNNVVPEGAPAVDDRPETNNESEVGEPSTQSDQGDAQAETSEPGQQPDNADAPMTQQILEQRMKAEEAFQALPNDAWKRFAEFAAENRSDPLVESFVNYLRTNSDMIQKLTISEGQTLVAAGINSVARIGLIGFQVFLTAFFFFFFCSGYGRVLAFIHKLLPQRNRELILDLSRKMDRVIAAFIRGRITIAAIQSIVFTIGYLVAGVPAALLLGIGVALLSIVPYLALIGIPISITLIFLDPPAGFRGEIWWLLGAPIGIYILGQALDDYIWTPLIQGKGTGMDTPTVLFASIAGGILAGFYGLLLAIPIAACIKILIQEVFWPRFKDWAEGRATDPLPFGRSSPEDQVGG